MGDPESIRCVVETSDGANPWYSGKAYDRSPGEVWVDIDHPMACEVLEVGADTIGGLHHGAASSVYPIVVAANCLSRARPCRRSVPGQTHHHCAGSVADVQRAVGRRL
jgi:hypothetical protein